MPYSSSVVVTPQNVNEIALNANAMKQQNDYLITIQNKLEDYLGLYHEQRALLIVSLLWPWHSWLQYCWGGVP